MTEPESQCMFAILVEKSFDRSFERGYSSIHFGTRVVRKLDLHTQPQAAANAATMSLVPSWIERRYGFSCRPLGLDSGTRGGTSHG